MAENTANARISYVESVIINEDNIVALVNSPVDVIKIIRVTWKEIEVDGIFNCCLGIPWDSNPKYSTSRTLY